MNKANVKHRNSSGAPLPLPDHRENLNDSASIREFQDIRTAWAGCTAQVTDATEEQNNRAQNQETNNVATRILEEREKHLHSIEFMNILFRIS